METDDSRIAADPPRGINIHLTIGHWAVVALAVVAVLEGIVIVGLLLTRPTGVSPEPAAKPAAASAPTTRPPTTGRLEITARPPGARVTVDGQLRGTSPLSLVLPVGKHDVTIAIGNRTLSQSVDITGGQPTVISPR